MSKKRYQKWTADEIGVLIALAYELNESNFEHPRFKSVINKAKWLYEKDSGLDDGKEYYPYKGYKI